MERVQPVDIWNRDGTVAMAINADGSLNVSNKESLSNYKISDIADGTTAYFGFVDKDGNWYILKLTETDARYCKGASGYTTAWTNRASQSYDYYNNVF